MTVSTTNSFSQHVAAGGTVFAFNFMILGQDELVVKTTTPGAADVTLVLGVDYTVSAGPWPSGGTITCSAPPANGDIVTLIGDPGLTQDVDLLSGSALPPEQIEAALDRLTLVAQRTRSIAERSLTLPDGSTLVSIELPAPAAGRYLVWNPGADAIVNALPSEDPGFVAQLAAAEAEADAAANSAFTADILASNANGWSVAAAASAVAAEASAVAAAAEKVLAEAAKTAAEAALAGMGFASTVLTFTNVPTGGENAAQNWAHGLTGNIEYGFSVNENGTITGGPTFLTSTAIDSDGYLQRWGVTNTVPPDDPAAYADRPAAGNIRVNVHNNSGDSVNSISVRVWARGI